MSRSIATASLVLAAALPWLAGCGSPEPAEAARLRPVLVAEAKAGPASQPISTTGVIVTAEEMRLSFKVAGIVRRIGVQDGQMVRKGEKLAELELAEVDAQVQEAKQVALKAQRDMERGETLYARQLISRQQLEDLRTQHEVSQAQLSAAAFNRSHAVIVAPGDGVVLRKLVEERETVPAGQPVLLVAPKDAGFVVRAGLADREIVRLRAGDRGTVRLDAWPGREIAVKITEVAGAANPATGLFEIEAALPEESLRLVSGLVAKLQLHPSADDGTLVHVPIDAVVEGDADRASVFVLQDGRAVRRDVRVAFITAQGVALAGGLQAGETIVTRGAPYLADGERVEVVGP